MMPIPTVWKSKYKAKSDCSSHRSIIPSGFSNMNWQFFWNGIVRFHRQGVILIAIIFSSFVVVVRCRELNPNRFSTIANLPPLSPPTFPKGARNVLAT
jgi:hypothetical protein